MSFARVTSLSRGEGQAHEQNNKCIKTDGGVIGLFDNANALAEWATTGPYIAEIVHNSRRPDQKDEYNIEDHHEDTDNFECQFRQDRDKLLNSFKRFGNPFIESEKELINIYSRQVLPESAAQLR